jgi:hypothetical protein
MPRTTITKKTAPGGYPILPVTADSLDLAMTAADVANKNQFAAGGNDLLIAQNSGASPYTFSVTSVADEKKRTGDVSAYSLGAGELAILGPFPAAGWMQPDGMIYLEANNAAVKFAIIAI